MLPDGILSQVHKQNHTFKIVHMKHLLKELKGEFALADLKCILLLFFLLITFSITDSG
jgi:hypothetical protein